MAVPKKRTSHSKKNSRAATWIRKANKQAQYAFSLASSVLKANKLSSFIYNLEVKESIQKEKKS